MTEPSEGIAHGKMPSEVILEIESGDGPFARTLLLRIVRFEACIETKQEEVEIQSEAQTIGEGYLLIETGNVEIAIRQVFIRMDCPNITCIYISSSLQLPEEFGAIFHTHVQPDVANLIDE